MAEHIDFKVISLNKIKQLTEDMVGLLSARKTTIGVKFVQQFVSDLSQALTDGIDGQTDFQFPTVDSIQSQTSNLQLSQDSNIQQKPNEAKEETIESKIGRLEKKTERIETMIETLIKPKNDHVFNNNNNFQSSGKFPIKQCFICQKRGHISTNCWFNVRNFPKQNNYRNFQYRKPFYQNNIQNNQNKSFLYPRRISFLGHQNWNQQWNQKPPNYHNDQRMTQNVGTSYRNIN